MSDKLKETMPDSADKEAVVDTVRDRYAGIAKAGSSCCGPSASSCCGDAANVASGLGYSVADLELLPEGANLGLGCGAPLQHLELGEGEAFLDLGSGAGIDALIAAKKVGPSGRVIGVDMTPEMLAKARENAAGHDNVDFREGRLENLPVDDASVDAVTSKPRSSRRSRACCVAAAGSSSPTSSSTVNCRKPSQTMFWPMSAAWRERNRERPTSSSSQTPAFPTSRS
jgi:hypothetical protein